jgi:hypothetical protein
MHGLLQVWLEEVHVLQRLLHGGTPAREGLWHLTIAARLMEVGELAVLTLSFAGFIQAILPQGDASNAL